MLNDVRVYPTGSGGPFAISERRTLPTVTNQGRNERAVSTSLIATRFPCLFKGEDRFRGLTPNETAVLCTLLRRARAEFEGRCWPTHAQLVEDLHGTISARHLTRVVASLRDKGWIAIRTIHANQQLPSGATVRGGERNVYTVDLARVLGANADSERVDQDGHDVHPRSANGDDARCENVEKLAGSVADAVDQDLNKITDPQRLGASGVIENTSEVVDENVGDEAEDKSSSVTAEAVACMVLAYWVQTAFPEYADQTGRTVDIAEGSDGHARVARVLGLLQRGFTAETLKDAVLGATLDEYARGAGCPLPLVFGEKILHYARLGAREREKRRRAVARERSARARGAEARARPPEPPRDRLAPEQMLADISRLFRGGAFVPRPDVPTSIEP